MSRDRQPEGRNTADRCAAEPAGAGRHRTDPEAAGREETGGRKKDRKGSGRPMRLDRLLAQEGLGTRSELGKAVRSGRALVNGAVEKDPGRRVSPEDEILFDGAGVGQEEYVYYMLNKPAGVISATEDGRLQTVLDLLRAPQAAGEMRSAPVLRRGLFPVGRLDIDTEGLLLITDDGRTAHRLLSPARHVDKTYYAIVTGQVTREDVRAFAEGLAVDDDLKALPADLVCISREKRRGAPEILREDDSGKPERANPCEDTETLQKLRALIPPDPALFLPAGITEYSQTFVTIREGKFHQIKRMFAAVGKEVLYLRRLCMGSLILDPSLGSGQFRPLTAEEVRALRRV